MPLAATEIRPRKPQFRLRTAAEIGRELAVRIGGRAPASPEARGLVLACLREVLATARREAEAELMATGRGTRCAHNLAQARRIADQAAVFWMCGGSGALVEHGPAEHVFSSPSNPEAALYLSGARG